MLTVFPGYLLTSIPTWKVVLRELLSNGDSIWLKPLTDEDGELYQVDNLSRAACNQVRVVDVAKKQKEDPHIGH